MASISSLTILLTNARRHVVKVSPNTSVMQILEDVCNSQKLNAEEFDLVYQNKPLDVSLSLRFANLPNNCLLELQPTKSKPKSNPLVTIALQLESGERFIDTFLSSVSLWDMVQHFKDKGNIENKSDESESDVEPVCIYMRNEVVGEEKMKSTTLRKLGITSGKVAIRLVFRCPESLKEQARSGNDLLIAKPANPTPDSDWGTWETAAATSQQGPTENPQPPTEEATSPGPESWGSKDSKIPWGMTGTEENGSLPRPDTDTTRTNGNTTPATDDSTDTLNANTEAEMEVDEPVVEEKVIVIGPRNAVLFDMKSAAVTPQFELPEEFFDLTVAEVRYLYNDLRRERQTLEERPLLLQSQRSSISGSLCYEHCILRIQFPDRLVIQANFLATDTVSSVFELLRSFLENPDCNFYLYTTPPRCVLEPSLKLAEAQLVPAAIIHFGCDIEAENYLSAKVRSQISTLAGATKSASKMRNPVQQGDVPHGEPEPQIGSTIPHRDQAGLDNVNRDRPRTTNIPKWFKTAK